MSAMEALCILTHCSLLSDDVALEAKKGCIETSIQPVEFYCCEYDAD